MSVSKEAEFKVWHAGEHVAMIDISGYLTAKSETSLMDAYQRASTPGVEVIILCFNDLEYMNSSGIGLLVTLLIRVKRNEQRLLAFGLSDHYRQIFDVTRLTEAIQIFDSEAQAMSAVTSGRARKRA